MRQFFKSDFFMNDVYFQIPFPAVFITPEVWIPVVIVKLAWNMEIMKMPPKYHLPQLRAFGMLER